MKKKNTSDKNILKIKAAGLNINEVEKTRKFILKQLSVNPYLTVYFENISQIDLSGIQLIESLKKTFSKAGKGQKIKIDIISESKEFLYKTGFKNFIEQFS